MYGILISFSIVLSLLLIEQRVKKANLDVQLFWKISFWTLILGIVGARLYHVVDLWDVYSRNIASTLYIWNGGVGIYGALILGLISLCILLRIHAQDTFLWLDKIAVPIPLAQAIGRWGNYFNGELLPYAIYESFLDLLLFFILVYLERLNILKGRIFLAYIAGYALIRLLLEPLKTNSWEVMGLNVAQSISILLMLGSFLWHLILKRKS